MNVKVSRRATEKVRRCFAMITSTKMENSNDYINYIYHYRGMIIDDHDHFLWIQANLRRTRISGSDLRKTRTSYGIHHVE